MKKNIYLGNFNITFGDEFTPMLEMFESVIYPSFTQSGIIRNVKEGNNTSKYFFNEVKLKYIDDEVCLTGNYVKQTMYNVVSQYQEEHLIESDISIPTAPYSRFIIFLKNHRMVLTKNEVNSPSIKSFAKTVEFVLKQYIRKKNKGLPKDEKTPLPNVNIINLNLDSSIEEALKNVKKIKSFTLCFFPLNNDINPSPLINDVNGFIKATGSNSANLRCNSPDSKEIIEETIKKSNGNFTPKLEVVEYGGASKRITSDTFTSSKEISISHNLSPEDDENIALVAKQEKKINYCSSDNAKLYEKILLKLQKIMNN